MNLGNQLYPKGILVTPYSILHNVFTPVLDIGKVVKTFVNATLTVNVHVTCTQEQQKQNIMYIIGAFLLCIDFNLLS